MGIACVIILLAGTLGAEEGPSRPLFDVGQTVEVTVANEYRAKGISVQHGRLELTGRLVAQDEKTLTVTSLDGTETVRYPAAGASLAGTVVALDDDWLTLDLGDRRPHVRVPLTAILQAKDSPQDTDGLLRRGARVRVHLSEPARSVTGRVLKIDDDSLLLRTSDGTEPLRLQRSSIWATEVFVRTGHKRRTGATVGAVVVGALGAGSGLVFGAAVNIECESHCHPAAPFVGAAVGGLVGGLAGGGLGSLIDNAAKTGRWQAVSSTPVSVSVAPRPRGGLSASLSFRF
jgi:hypothetical protein